MTEYVVTRWYRAPELLLSNNDFSYSSAVDMWSAGCILVEVFMKTPLFMGCGVKDMLKLICRVTGKPSPDEIEAIPNKHARKFMSELSDVLYKGTGVSGIMPNAEDKAKDLARRLLTFDPKKRISAREALEHPYFEEYRDPRTEKTAEFLNTTRLEPPSETKLGRDGVRYLMWNEILAFHPGARERETPAAKDARRKFEGLISCAE